MQLAVGLTVLAILLTGSLAGLLALSHADHLTGFSAGYLYFRLILKLELTFFGVKRVYLNPLACHSA